MKISGSLDLTGGMFQNARIETVPALPSFSVGVHEGRLFYVNTGVNTGYWFGSVDGSASFQRLNLSTTLIEYNLSDQAINNGVTLQATISPPSSAAQKGMISKVELSSNLSAGPVTVKIYNDSGRLDQIYEAVFDLANLSTDRLVTLLESDSATGDIYVDITNNTGVNGTFSLDITVAGVILVQVPPPPGNGSGVNAEVAGEGISYDAVNARLLLDLATNPGLELTGSGGDKQLRVLVDPSGGIARGASGIAVDSTVVKTSGPQTVTGAKSFSAFSMVVAGSPGAPTSGTHVKGEFYMDSNQDVWMCITAGTPGTWVLYSWKESHFGGETDSSSYTGNVTAGNSASIVLEATGRRGMIRKLNIWGAAASFAATNLDIPFRVIAYPNENMEGREQLWSISGQVRTTYVSGTVLAGNTVIGLNSVGGINLDDLLRFRQAVTPVEEYQRVTVRSTSPVQVTVDETTVNDLAANDLCSVVTEYVNLTYRNNSGIAANQGKIYLKIINDHPSTTVNFGYEAWVEEMGGGLGVS